MKVLLLSCSTGEGHNNCARAVKEELERRNIRAEFLDMLQMFGSNNPLSFDKILNKISSKTPELFGMMYHAGAMFSSSGVTSPIYLANIRHAAELDDFIVEKAYDAVVCSHLFPMENAKRKYMAFSLIIPAFLFLRKQSWMLILSLMRMCARSALPRAFPKKSLSPQVCLFPLNSP